MRAVLEAHARERPRRGGAVLGPRAAAPPPARAAAHEHGAERVDGEGGVERTGLRHVGGGTGQRRRPAVGHEAEQRPQQRRLPGAVRAEDAGDRAAWELEGDIAERLGTAEGDGEAADGDARNHRGTPLDQPVVSAAKKPSPPSVAIAAPGGASRAWASTSPSKTSAIDSAADRASSGPTLRTSSRAVAAGTPTSPQDTREAAAGKAGDPETG